jgi:hypothetical protein
MPFKLQWLKEPFQNGRKIFIAINTAMFNRMHWNQQTLIILFILIFIFIITLKIHSTTPLYFSKKDVEQ